MNTLIPMFTKQVNNIYLNIWNNCKNINVKEYMWYIESLYICIAIRSVIFFFLLFCYLINVTGE